MPEFASLTADHAENSDPRGNVQSPISIFDSRFSIFHSPNPPNQKFSSLTADHADNSDPRGNVQPPISIFDSRFSIFQTQKTQTLEATISPVLNFDFRFLIFDVRDSIRPTPHFGVALTEPTEIPPSTKIV